MSTQHAPSVPGANPGEHLLHVATGYMASACVNAAAHLKIADLLAGGPKPVAELAVAAEANEDALYRLLRALAATDVFKETAPRVFANTPASEPLRSGPHSLRDLVIWFSDPFHLRFYAEFLHTAKTGGDTISKVSGMGLFEFTGKEKAFGAVFNAAMTSLSAMLLPAVMEAYDFGGLGTLADIAGGHGLLLTGILQKHGDVQGVVFDMPGVVPGTDARIASLGLGAAAERWAAIFSNRCRRRTIT